VLTEEIMRRFAVIVCVLAAAAPALAQDASGRWDLTVTTTQRPARTTSLVLKKDGDKLSGTIVGPQNAELAVSGTQTGAEVAFAFNVTTQNGNIVVSMKGRQDGDSMKGTLEIATGEDRGDWTAVRAATAPSTSPVDLTGTWAFEVRTEAGTRTPTVMLKQEGARLTGRYKSQLGEAPVTGEVKDKNFTFQVTLPIEGNPMTITYTGTVDRTIVNGRVSVADVEVGTFTGKKQETGDMG
jgi:hypothetical protein